MNKTIVIGGDVSLINTIDGDTSLLTQEDGQGDKLIAPLGWVGAGVPHLTEDDFRCEIADYQSTSHIPMLYKAHQVSIPVGYYAEPTLKYNPFGEMQTDTATSVQIGNDGTATIVFAPSVHGMAYEVGEYTLTKAGAVDVKATEAITPTKQAQTIATEGKYCTGDMVVNPIPDQYEIYNWMGSQAEFVSTVYPTAEFTLKSTSFNGWTPSTTAKTIKSGVNGSTFVADMTQYEYMILWRCDWNVEYSTGYTDVARTIKGASIICQLILRRPNSLANIASENYAGNACVTYRTSPIMEYWNNNGSHTYTWGASYGIYPSATAATFSNSTSDNPTVTTKTPAWSARCSTTYFSTGNAGKVDQDKSKFRMKGELYRFKIGSPERSIENLLVSLFNNYLEV